MPSPPILEMSGSLAISSSSSFSRMVDAAAEAGGVAVVDAAAAPPVAEPEPASAQSPARPVDEWERYYSINLTDASARPVLLTTTDGLIENQTSVATLGRRQDLLLLHQRQGYRAPRHLGCASLRRHAGTAHVR